MVEFCLQFLTEQQCACVYAQEVGKVVAYYGEIFIGCLLLVYKIYFFSMCGD